MHPFEWFGVVLLTRAMTRAMRGVLVAILLAATLTVALAALPRAAPIPGAGSVAGAHDIPVNCGWRIVTLSRRTGPRSIEYYTAERWRCDYEPHTHWYETAITGAVSFGGVWSGCRSDPYHRHHIHRGCISHLRRSRIRGYVHQVGVGIGKLRCQGRSPQR